MSTSATIPEPTPPRRRVPWLRRLWVRIGIVLLLIVAISALAWSVPRRTSIAIRWHGGHVMSHDDLNTAKQIHWRLPNFKSQSPIEKVIWVTQWISVKQPDENMTWVDLSKANVDDGWLVNLGRFPRLQFLGLHNRQLGPGLDDVSSNLKWIAVHEATAGRLSELRRFPDLVCIEICRPSSDELGFDTLKDLESLTEVGLTDCEETSEIIRQLGSMRRLTSIQGERCKNLSDESLKHLADLPHLRAISLTSCSSIGDAGLAQLSRISSLEGLVLIDCLDKITDRGVKSLAGMKKLRNLVVSQTDLTAQQWTKAEELLPNCRVTVRPPK